LNKIPAPYQVSSLFIGIIIYLYYEFFSMMMKNIFPVSDKIGILFMSISIALQLFGIQYFLTKMKGSFGELIVSSESKDDSLCPFDLLKTNFTTSRVLYLLILAAFLLFATAKIDAFYSGSEPFFSQGNPTSWALGLDIYNNLVSLFLLYLLAILLWMIFNISYMLFKINNDLYALLKIEPLDADRAGGLKPLKELLLGFNIFYFLIIPLAVFANFASRGLSSFESASIGLLWLIGVVLFLYDWYALRRFLRGKIGDGVSILSEIQESKRKQLIDLVSKNEEKENEGQICLLSNVLDIIDKERERIQQYKIKLIDAKTIILFAGFSALSLIAILKGSGEDGRSSTAVFVIDNARPLIDDCINYVGYMVNYLYQFLPK